MHLYKLLIALLLGFVLTYMGGCKDGTDFAGQNSKSGKNKAGAGDDDDDDNGKDGDDDDDGIDGNGNDNNNNSDLDEGGNGADGVPKTTEECLTYKADQYNIVLVFDNSGSQNETDPQTIRRTAAINFVNTFEQFKKDNDKTEVNMSAVSFSDTATKSGWHSLGQGTAGIAQDITVATDNPDGRTNYSFPLNAANELLGTLTQKSRVKNYVVFLTDGEPNALTNPGFPGVSESLQDIENARNNLITSHNASIIAIAAGNGIRPEGISAVEKLADLPSQGGR